TLIPGFLSSKTRMIRLYCSTSSVRHDQKVSSTASPGLWAKVTVVTAANIAARVRLSAKQSGAATGAWGIRALGRLGGTGGACRMARDTCRTTRHAFRLTRDGWRLMHGICRSMHGTRRVAPGTLRTARGTRGGLTNK